MSVAAVMLVRDEADIIRSTLSWLETQVDAIYVADNRSVDGTREIIDAHAAAAPVHYHVVYDMTVGYWQSKKTTSLADLARKDLHDWVVPVDADERWECAGSAYGTRLGDYLDAVGFDVQVVKAALYDYWPTALDNPEESDPVRRIGWRQRKPSTIPKVACRTHPNLTIEAGNHSARYGRAPFVTGAGLQVRHYSWRDEDQYLRKIRNGSEAYRATDLPPQVGTHWRMFDDVDDDTVREHFRTWFFKEDPSAAGLVFDPAVA